jgi:deoxyadenosine/deoxycytidine kinase
MIVHIDAGPELCLERVAGRGREFEAPDKLPLTVLQALDARYSEFIERPEIAERLVVLPGDWTEQDVQQLARSIESRARTFMTECFAQDMR